MACPGSYEGESLRVCCGEKTLVQTCMGDTVTVGGCVPFGGCEGGGVCGGSEDAVVGLVACAEDDGVDGRERGSVREFEGSLGGDARDAGKGN